MTSTMVAASPHAGMGTLPGGVPSHPLVSDATTRAIMHSLVESTSLGMALLGGRPWAHELVNLTYERFVGRSETLGRDVTGVLPPEVCAALSLDDVATAEHPMVLPDVSFGHHAAGGEMSLGEG
jgi:hypothetical protein